MNLSFTHLRLTSTSTAGLPVDLGVCVEGSLAMHSPSTASDLAERVAS